MHKGGNKRYLNLIVAGRFVQETCTSTDTSWASMRVSSHMHHTGLGLGRLGGDQASNMRGYQSRWVL